jgi:hypothetical protein
MVIHQPRYSKEEFARKRRPLEAVMSDISRKAQARGLTPEILNNLLSE